VKKIDFGEIGESLLIFVKKIPDISKILKIIEKYL